MLGCSPFLYFRGGAARFSFFFGGYWLLVLSLIVCWLWPFGNKFLTYPKKKTLGYYCSMYNYQFLHHFITLVQP